MTENMFYFYFIFVLNQNRFFFFVNKRTMRRADVSMVNIMTKMNNG